MKLLTTSAAAWRHLTTTSGFDPAGYDRPLADFLRSPDGLDLGPSSDIGRELESRAVPIETFLEAFFRGMRPYGQMLQDLLNLFTEAGAQHGDHGLAVEFDFGRGVDLGFDLEQFRQWLAHWARSHGTVVESRWTTDQLWRLLQILGQGDENSMPADLRRWNREYREDGRWPTTRVALPATGDPELDRFLQRAWRLWETVLRECARWAPDRRELNRLWHQSWNEENRDREGVAETAWPLQVLGGLDSDLWPASLVSGLVSMAREARSRGSADSSIAEQKARLQALFSSLPAKSVERETWVLEWQAYLDLPLWKQRHELYSAWVSTQILAATEPLARRVHCENGVLRFAFGGSHVATLPTLEPAVHLWAELRSPIEHRPLGLGRKTKIQPDFTLLCDPVTGKRSAFLVVECKQYQHASKKNFLQALIDYARGRPEALIVLVNYGPIPEHWLGEAPLELQDRLRMIGDFRPGQDASLAQFRRVVGQEVKRQGSRLAATKQAGLAAAVNATTKPDLRRIILRWTSDRDLDLHLFCNSADRSDHIYYAERGSLENEPWVALDQDCQYIPGREEIELEKSFEGLYRCFVHAYSGGSLESADAEVEIEYRGSRVRMTCPATQSGTWWHVCDWDSQSGELRVVGRVGGDAPPGLS